MRRVTLLATIGLLLAAATVATAGPAAGAGGRTIADAPLIPLGQEQVNALNGIDFYRVALRVGDQLTIRYGPQQQLHWAEVCLFQPGISDTTVGNQPCYAKKNTTLEDSFTLGARTAGNWVIAVVPYPGCDANGVLSLTCGVGLQYRLTAFVKHQTTLTLQAPNAVRRGSWFGVSGRLAGGASGSVVLEASWDDGGHWAPVALRHLGSSGRYSAKLRFRRAGALTLRASFPEAPLFAPSSALVKVRVV